MTKVESSYVGDVWPAAEPGDDPVLYGSVTLTPGGSFEARSLQTFTLVYTVGRFGLDDTGAIKVVHRYPNDWGRLQMDDPKAINFVTAHTSNATPLRLKYEPDGEQRPWYRSLMVDVKGGCLREGDTITIVFGDRSQGSPGLTLQTFCESDFEFKVLADVCATGHFIPVSDTPSIAIVPGPAAVWKAVLPTLRRPGDIFRLGIKAEDLWGNPTGQAQARLSISANLPVKGLPTEIAYGPDQRAMTINDLQVAEDGVLRITIRDDSGHVLAESNPLVIRAGQVSGYWGDMHGQSGESVGINTAREYFDFARNLSFLDATGHQANDFQINNAFWQLINDLSADYQEDHRFVTYPGYEWSGNTAVGGDRNVYFRTEGRQIRRSSHALLPDRSDLDTDATSATRLFEDLQGEDCVVYAHVGGRYADIAQAHDPRLETAMEIHSAWGTFEWLLTDGFALGHRSGVVCNSDGHKGRPGASYPGAASFGAYGGLTCFLSSELTRDALFDCQRRRRHYGTTGNRLHLDVRAKFHTAGNFFERDPRYFDVTPQPTDAAMMGDIAQTDDAEVALSIECITQTPIERIDILNGAEVVSTLRGFAEADLGERIRVIWQGAEYRGRGRRTLWTGQARFHGHRITRLSPINAWNHERPTDLKGLDTVTWDTLTTGNFGGFDAWLDPAEGGATGQLEIETNHVSGAFDLTEIGLEDTVLEAGGLERKVRVFRLPAVNDCRELRGSVNVALKPEGDNPIWVRVTTEDGYNAWSSPVFLYRKSTE
ncbi:MAG: DUF3604 domain-containing protein [Alphaproteobacteria bacterium]|nr:DUF3604 domain-containing protein [Alphaproteobacteria bacterium]